MHGGEPQLLIAYTSLASFVIYNAFMYMEIYCCSFVQTLPVTWYYGDEAWLLSYYGHEA